MDLLHGHLFLLKAGWGTGEEGVMNNGGVEPLSLPPQPTPLVLT